MPTGGDTGLDASALVPSFGDDVDGGVGHVVQLYENDGFLVDALSRFVGAGLGAGDTTIVIATPPHRDGVESRLRARGVDLGLARAERRYVALDAAETLAAFMVDGWPNETRFVNVITAAIPTTASGPRPRVRAFGEMVRLLWAEGRRAAAIRLEGLWNDLGRRFPFELICAYPMSVFTRDDDTGPFARMCEAHSRLIPAESYSARSTVQDRLRAIGELQLKARSLEVESAARKAAETSLRRYQEEMADFFENAPVPLHLVGPDGTILQANRAELDLLGYAADEYVGHNVGDFHADTETIEDILGRLQRGETLHDYEARLRCKDGSIREVLIDSNVLWEDGRFIHTRCTMRDVTERNRAEVERERLLRAAEHARVEAESASRSKDEFLSVLSHELRTPLASMLGWVAVLKTGAAGERAARALETIERSGRAQAKLIEDLVDVSRIVTGRMRLDLRLVDLPAAMGAALETIRPTADAKGVRLEAWLDPTAAPVAGDADRLQQVAWNLLSNAVKFTPAGGLVRIRLERREDDVQLVVHDTGRGISPEFLSHVFERFRQEDVAISRRTGGLGLGLAIVRHLVELHGGTVAAASKGEGQGATFAVTLPLPPVRSDGARSGRLPFLLAGLRVLVVDDEPDARDAVRAILESHGAMVAVAASVREARDLIRLSALDAVVSDIRLPDGDGYALVRELRGMDAARTRSIPAVAITGHDLEEDEGRAVAAGYQVRLTKPVDPELLVAAVAQLAAPGRRRSVGA
jgi:PAS domain S-box-containing protein